MATLPRNRALLSSLISAVASVAVALVGILPQLWAKDQTIARQRKQIEELEGKVSGIEELLEVSTSRVRWTISGRIRREGSDQGQGTYEVYLVPGNKYVTQSSDDGRFVFEDFFPGSYALVVRDSTGTRRAARGLITPSELAGSLSLETHGAWADYKAVPQSVPTVAADARPAEKAATALAAVSLPAQNGGLQ